MAVLTNDNLADIITDQLPQLLKDRPELKSSLYHIFLEAFAENGELGHLRQEVAEFRNDTQANFALLANETQRGFQQLETQLEQFGKRWGLQSEAVFRATIISLLEKSFQAKVERRKIAGDEYDLVISREGEHILVEIAASVKRNIQERLERKRALYTAETGVRPTRFILAVANIYSRRAQALREAGFEVIEPGDEEDWAM
ncbi:MAG: DUF3782 domain-containing protein [Chloroflexota bacterium]